MTGPRLSPDQRRALQMVYDRFHERGTWTTFGEVDRPLRRLGLEPDVIIESMPRDLLLPFQAGRTQPIARDELKLSLKGIAACAGGEEDIDVFLRVIPWLAKRELGFEPGGDGTDEYLRVTASEIRAFLQLPDDPSEAIGRLRQIINLQRWGWSGGEFAGGEWYVQVGRDISRFAQVQLLDNYLEVMTKWEEEGRRPYATIPDDFDGTDLGIVDAEYEPQPVVGSYVSATVISSLEAAGAESGWDCGKLLRLIHELNDNYASGNAYSAHAMLRAILDHVPPLFGYQDFKEAANNYSWPRADRPYMKRLLEFKGQGHDVLHRQITKSPDVITIEDMPQRVAINRLLQECAGLL
jgi:hypothetical protein